MKPFRDFAPSLVIKPLKLDDPPPEELRAAIMEQRCWWCGRDGFRLVAGHTNKAHGIDRRMLKELAQIVRGFVTTCEDLHDFQVKRGLRDRDKFMASIAEQKAKRPPGELRAQLLAAVKRAHELHDWRKPHPCTNCGTMIPTSRPLTCSPACQLAVRRRGARYLTRKNGTPRKQAECWRGHVLSRHANGKAYCRPCHAYDERARRARLQADQIAERAP